MGCKGEEIKNDIPQDPARRKFVRAAGVLGLSMAAGGTGSHAKTLFAEAQSGSGIANPEAIATGEQSTSSPGEVPRRSLGRTGVQISALGVGGHHLGDFPGVD